MAATMTDKRRSSLNRLSGLFTRPTPKSLDPDSPRLETSSNTNLLKRKAQSRDMQAAHTSGWPLAGQPQALDSQRTFSSPVNSSASRNGPFPHTNVPQTSRQRSATTGHTAHHQSHHHSRVSEQAALPNYPPVTIRPVGDAERSGPITQEFPTRTSGGNDRSQANMPLLQKKQPSVLQHPPPALSNAKVDPSVNYLTAATQRDPNLKTTVPAKKKRGLFGAKSKNAAEKIVGPSAWIAGGLDQIPYDVALLAGGAKVSI
jgi:hypothetical protein